MNIIKKSNGLVVIVNPSGGYASRSFTNATIDLKRDNETFEIWTSGKLVFSFKFSDVVSTQIEPAAPVAVTTVAALLALLQTSFFFESSVGGGASSATIATAAVTAFSNRTGVVNATITAALYDMIKDLDTNSLWSKMVGFYPMVGGNAFAHGTNLKDPLKYNLTFFGGWTHSANGALPNGINGYANTNIPYNAPELYYGGTYLNRTLGYYSRTVSAASGVLLGLNNGGGTIDYLYPNPITSAISEQAIFTGSTATTKFMAVSMADGANGIFYRDTVSLPMAFFVTGASIPDPYFLAASNQNSGTPGFFSNCQCALAFVSTGLTLAELNIVNTIVNSFQLALTRNV